MECQDPKSCYGVNYIPAKFTVESKFGVNVSEYVRWSFTQLLSAYSQKMPVGEPVSVFQDPEKIPYL